VQATSEVNYNCILHRKSIWGMYSSLVLYRAHELSGRLTGT